MKISMFHLMPYRDLPDDFAQKYHSVWVDPPYCELADSVKVGQYYNWTLDELIHAATRASTVSASTSIIKTLTASCRIPI